MTPLQQIAAGLLLVVLDSTTELDTLPDPLGWLLLLPAVARLPAHRRGAPLAAGAVAALASVATYLPGPRAALTDGEPALEWALLLLPDLAFAWLLCRALAALAVDAGDLRAASWWRVSGTVLLLLALAPVPFLATGRAVPGDLGLVLQVTWLVVVVLLFRHHRRPWAPARRSGPDRSAAA